MIKCKECMHWEAMKGGFYGVCAVKMGDQVEIQCEGGWEGCVIGDVETEADFFCSTGEEIDE